jgi:hypothetical protein
LAPGAVKIAIQSATVKDGLESGSANYAIDGQTDTVWNAGQAVPQSLDIDLGSTTFISSLRLLPTAAAAGDSLVEVYVGDVLGEGMLKVAGFGGALEDSSWADLPFGQNVKGRYVRITFAQAMSVSLREVEVYGQK